MYKLAIKVKWIKVNKRWESKTRRRASMRTISDLERESELGKSESECEMGEKGRQTPNSHCPQSMTLVTDHCQTCQKESK